MKKASKHVHKPLEGMDRLVRKLGHLPRWVRKGHTMTMSPKPNSRNPYEYLVAWQITSQEKGVASRSIYYIDIYGLRADDLDKDTPYNLKEFVAKDAPCEAVAWPIPGVVSHGGPPDGHLG